MRTTTMKTKAEVADRNEALDELRKILGPGNVVFTIVRHVSRSGMRRSISAVVVVGGEPWILDHLIRRALGLRVDQKHGGVVVDGAGMDMGFHLVYQLGHALWPNGTPTPHRVRNGVPDTSGGYALNHRWL